MELVENQNLTLGWKMIDGGKVQFWGCLCFARMDPTLFCRELVTMCQAKGLVWCMFEP
ncbi:unnamed protein product [Trifolium pratense]|uniref:Uncharacterized protein n=1 Tax=Trifolium pratense TaxID=57577 RepID=A0ACB0IXE8_TRIPR|nr:unnamed protein product [Trifolium pratense]